MKKILLILFLIIYFLLTAHCVEAYSAKTTHPALTSQVVSFYNYLHPDNPITEEQKNWLILGSELEDISPRWVNHFYDPIRKISWNYETMNKSDESMTAQLVKALTVSNKTTAVDWVNNTIYQRRAEGGEKTWGKAISYLADKNEKEGFIALGHILHLLEDMGVPAHTRNDPHPDVGNLGSPYEKFARGYNISNIEKRTGVLEKLKSEDINLPKGSIEDHLTEMAKYSNKYFFSKDTINNSIYDYPKILRIKNGLAYGLDTKNKEYILCKAKYILESGYNYSFPKNLSISREIFEEYFNRLSYQIILRGVSVLEMVPDEVLKELENRKYGAGNEGKYRRVGFLDKLGKDRSIVGGVSKAWGGMKSFFGNISNVVKETFKSEKSFNEAEEISLLDDSKNIIEENKDVEKEIFEFCSFDDTKIPGATPVRINEIAWMGDKDSYKNEWIELKNISGEVLDVSNYQVIDQKNQIKYVVPNGTKLPILGVYLISRSKDSSVANLSDDFYSGSLSNSDEGLQLYDGNCVLRDAAYSNGSWPSGDNNSKQTMERSHDGGWHTSVLSGGTPGDLNSEPKIKEDNQEENKDEVNNEESEKAEEEEELDNEDSEEEEEIDNEENNESEEVSETAEDNSSNDNESEVSYSECSFETSLSPNSNNLIINEIAWMGTNESSSDEWIELKNISNESINLNGYQLIDKEEQIHIIFEETDEINPDDYYLLERTDEDSVIGILSDKIYTGSLKNSDEGLRLFDNSCNLLDEYITDGDWIEGNNSFKKTMERTDNLGWQTSSEAGGTPKEENSNPVQIYYGGTGGGSSGSNSEDDDSEDEPENEKPISNFSYSPDSPNAGDRVLFDSSSSTDPDGSIDYFKWDFNTDFITTTTDDNIYYIYENPGNFNPVLSVYDNDGDVSTSSLFIEISEDSGSLADNIVISEIMPGISGDSDKEFIELYNPTDEDVDLTNWSLERNLDRETTSTQTLVDSFVTSTIPSHSFFLIKSQQYEDLESDEIYTNKSYHLAYSDDGLILKDNNEQKIDEYFYDSVSRGYSLERKTFENDSCYVSQDNYEYLGNSCGLDSFDEREEPNPQNLNSLKEPRNLPESDESFTAEYDWENLNIVFDWGTYEDEVGATSSISYEIKEYNSPGVVIYSSSTIGSAKNIDEIGREYNFSFQAFDKDGLGSEITTTTVSVPSFFDNFYFYNNASTTDYLADFYYSKYPFVPDKYNGTRKALVAYLNKEAFLENNLIMFNGWDISDRDGIMSFVYDNSNRNKNHKGLIPVFSDEDESLGGNSPMKGEIIDYSGHGLGEDNHIILKFASSSNEINLTEEDYINFAFYGYNTSNSGRNNFKPIAIDKTKYYFQNNVPDHKSPSMTQLNTNFDNGSNLEISWNIATDEDTIDSEITYEINFIDLANSSSTNFSESNWENNENSISYIKNVAPQDNYLIGVRALDDFKNYSNISTTTWSYPPSLIVYSQSEENDFSENWGYRSSGHQQSKAIFQEFISDSDYEFNKASLKLKQEEISDQADIKLRVFSDNEGLPDFSNILGESSMSLINPNSDEEKVFNFDTNINFASSTIYWFQLLADYSDGRRFYRNEWSNAVYSTEDVINGRTGLGPAKECDDSVDIRCEEFDLGSKPDWYLKLIFE